MSNEKETPQLPYLPVELKVQTFQEAARLDVDYTYLDDVHCFFALIWRISSASIMGFNFMVTCRLAHLTALEEHRQASEFSVYVPAWDFYDEG